MKLSFKASLYLFYLYWEVKVKEIIEGAAIILRYYRNLSFFWKDINYRWLYFWKSPYAISKSFLLERGEVDIYTYGETPLTTLHKIAKAFQIQKNDVVFELGCGAGRSSYWLSEFIGSKVIGVDYVPGFAERFKKLSKRTSMRNVVFKEEDFFETDLSSATVIYLCGTCLEESVVSHLAAKIKKEAPHAQIITVSYSFEELGLGFETVDTIKAPFLWGPSNIYLQRATV